MPSNGLGRNAGTQIAVETRVATPLRQRKPSTATPSACEIRPRSSTMQQLLNDFHSTNGANDANANAKATSLLKVPTSACAPTCTSSDSNSNQNGDESDISLRQRICSLILCQRRRPVNYASLPSRQLASAAPATSSDRDLTTADRLFGARTLCSYLFFGLFSVTLYIVFGQSPAFAGIRSASHRLLLHHGHSIYSHFSESILTADSAVLEASFKPVRSAQLVRHTQHLHSLFARLDRGEPIRIGVVGGSISFGSQLKEGAESEFRYDRQLLRHLHRRWPVDSKLFEKKTVSRTPINSTNAAAGNLSVQTSQESPDLSARDTNLWPHTDHTLANRASRGMTSAACSFCFRSQFTDQVYFNGETSRDSAVSALPDLLLIEFAVNDAVDFQAGQYSIAENVERLVRSAMTEADRHADLEAGGEHSPHSGKRIAILFVLLFCITPGRPFATQTAQAHYTKVAKHYELPYVSTLEQYERYLGSEAMRRTLAKIGVAESSVLRSLYHFDNVHPNELGHTFIAQLVIDKIDSLFDEWKQSQQHSQAAVIRPTHNANATAIGTKLQESSLLPAAAAAAAAPVLASPLVPLVAPLSLLNSAHLSYSASVCKVMYSPFVPGPNRWTLPMVSHHLNVSYNWGFQFDSLSHKQDHEKRGICVPTDEANRMDQYIRFGLATSGRSIHAVHLISERTWRKEGSGAMQAYLSCHDHEGKEHFSTPVTLDSHWNNSNTQADVQLVYPTIEQLAAQSQQDQQSDEITGGQGQGESESDSESARNRILHNDQIACNFDQVHVKHTRQGTVKLFGLIYVVAH